MYQDYYQYFQWMQHCIHKQEQRIAQLEKQVQEMAQELKQMKEKPVIHVDTIEYKFDQLKVETVEGTLNIGLNPSDLQGIEDLAVNKAPEDIPPVHPKAQMMRSMEIEEAMFHYLETDLPDIILMTQNQLNMVPNEAYLSFVKEDIKKQLPGRIDAHLKSFAGNDRNEKDAKSTNQKIINQLKNEIQNGVMAFFQHLLKNMKG